MGSSADSFGMPVRCCRSGADRQLVEPEKGFIPEQYGRAGRESSLVSASSPAMFFRLIFFLQFGQTMFSIRSVVCSIHLGIAREPPAAACVYCLLSGLTSYQGERTWNFWPVGVLRRIVATRL